MALHIVNDKFLVDIYYYDDYFVIESDKYNKALEDKIKSFGDKYIFQSKNLSWRVSNDFFDCFMNWIKSHREILISIERFDSDCNNTSDNNTSDSDDNSDDFLYDK